MKVTGFLPVGGGVSQLPPHLRHPGAAGEQINFIPDPAVGVSRRHGSVFLGERSIGVQPAASFDDASNWRSFPWNSGGGEYVVLCRVRARTAGCTLPAVQVWDVAGKRFLPVETAAGDTDLQELHATGASAFAGSSKFAFLAANGTLPTGSVEELWQGTSASQGAVWIRGGASDRTYTVTVAGTAGTHTASYRTPPPNYPQALDTSLIQWYVAESPVVLETAQANLTVLEAPSRGLCYLGVSNVELLSVSVVDDTGTSMVQVSTPLPVGGQQFYLPLAVYGSIPTMYLAASQIGRQITVTYRWRHIGQTAEYAWVEQRVVGAGARQGYAYLPAPFEAGHPSIGLGLTLVMADWGNLVDTQYFYNPTVHPNYVLFNATHIGKTYTATGQRKKVKSNPDYQRLVDDAKIGYERNVTAYLLDAANKTTPEHIAEQLCVQLRSRGVNVTRTGTHLAIIHAGITLTVSDDGDGEMIRAVDAEVSAVADLTDLHYPGKVVKIRPADGSAYFYLQAQAKGSGTGFQEVLWVEGAGQRQSVSRALYFLQVAPAGDLAWLASSPAHMDTLSGGGTPQYAQSTSGDTSQIQPLAFIGRPITMLALFQDRLLIGAGGTVTVSAVGDYLRLYPTSVVTLPADSAFEFKAQGSDSDTIRHSAFFGRDLLLFGDLRQYVISGKAVLAPTSASLAVISSIQGASDVQPASVGGLLFLATHGERGTAVSQMRPSLDPDNPDITTVSQALTTYLAGTPIELARRNNPDTVYLRCADSGDRVFLFRFSDTGQGRTHAAWYSWQFSPQLGKVMGIRPTEDGVLVFFIRQQGGSAYLVADMCSEAVGLSPRPYLDSLRPLATFLSGTVPVSSGWFAAYSQPSTRFLIGDSVEALADLRAAYGDANLYVGAEQPTEFEVTPPVPKDRTGNPNRRGVLTVTSVAVDAAESSGLVASTSRWTQNLLVRRVGDASVIGRIPVGDWQQVVCVGQDSKTMALTVRALKWYPLTITGLEYTGQFFDRPPRM